MLRLIKFSINEKGIIDKLNEIQLGNKARFGYAKRIQKPIFPFLRVIEFNNLFVYFNEMETMITEKNTFF